VAQGCQQPVEPAANNIQSTFSRAKKALAPPLARYGIDRRETFFKGDMLIASLPPVAANSGLSAKRKAAEVCAHDLALDLDLKGPVLEACPSSPGKRCLP